VKIKRSLLYFIILVLLLASCDEPQDGGGASSPITNPSNVPPRKFWAQNLVTENFYQLEAELFAESSYCKVWVERGSGVSVATAASVARAYDNEIRPKMLNVFAYKGTLVYNNQEIAHNTLEFADWLGDGDRKLCILLLDIADDYKPGVNDSYCAGYFWAGNLFANTDTRDPQFRYSNECDMICIDTNPGNPGSQDSNATLAHEMQHMMSFVSTTIAKRRSYLDLWIDEGLSSAAEWLYYGSHSGSRVTWYNQDKSGLIRKGNNFFVWDNHENESPYALLDDYATVYLFFQWLRLQANSNNVYYNIILSNEYDYKAVTNAANLAMPGRNYNNWEILLKTWHAANYINAPSGPYGYKNEATLNNIQARTAPAGIKNINLAPGEGVYSITNDFSLPANTQNINYSGLSRDSAEQSDTKTFSGGALLTFNTNTNIVGAAASGATTGVASVEAMKMGFDSNSASPGVLLSGPFAIGAGDILRRNGHDGSSVIELKKFKTGLGFE